MKKMITLIMAFLVVLTTSCGPGEEELPKGMSGKLVFNAGVDFDNALIDVHYYVPPGDPAKMDFQFILHGMDRNAYDYLVPWAAKARKYGLVTIAPEFSEAYFNTDEYNEGNLISGTGAMNPPAKTTFSLIDRIFEFVLEELDLSSDTYNIYGHSAGGQFVHRFMMFYESPYVDKAVAANPGWYTYPDATINYPYGVNPYITDINSFREVYHGKELTILLGMADTLRTSSLRTTPEADAQGLNRFERGNNFFNANQQWATGSGHQFRWHVQHVPDVGHDHTLMSPAAADFLYGGDKKGK
ncbi:MAG: hypothetical protein IH591_09675 [Bacteroidales bacterium]|nr:hypothetical protein [Bacteroidales bacterium]